MPEDSTHQKSGPGACSGWPCSPWEGWGNRATHRVFRQPETGANPAATSIVDRDRGVHCTARGLDDPEPTLAILQPSEAAGAIAAPPLASGVAADVGEERDGARTPERRAAGGGQVRIAVAREGNMLGGTATACNVVTRRFAPVQRSALIRHLVPRKPAIIKSRKGARLSGSRWTGSLPSTDRDGNAMFVSAETSYIAAAAREKAGHVAGTYVSFVVE